MAVVTVIRRALCRITGFSTLTRQSENSFQRRAVSATARKDSTPDHDPVNAVTEAKSDADKDFQAKDYPTGCCCVNVNYVRFRLGLIPTKQISWLALAAWKIACFYERLFARAERAINRRNLLYEKSRRFRVNTKPALVFARCAHVNE